MITLLNIEMLDENGHGGFKLIRVGEVNFPAGSLLFLEDGRETEVLDQSFYLEFGLVVRVIHVTAGKEVATTGDELRKYCEENEWKNWPDIILSLGLSHNA